MRSRKAKPKKTELFPLLIPLLIPIWIYLHAMDTSVIISASLVDLSITGITGVLGVVGIGFYLSINYVNPDSGFCKHLVNSIFLVVFAIVAYFIGKKIFALAMYIVTI